jgi:hypothetical protein
MHEAPADGLAHDGRELRHRQLRARVRQRRAAHPVGDRHADVAEHRDGERVFDAGTIRGTFKITSTATPAGVVTYVGSAKISGGTGAYAHARGTAKLACESQDRGLHATCTEKLTLTKI